MLKVFNRFLLPQQLNKLVDGLIKERKTRQRLEELKDYKKRGFTDLSQIEIDIQNRRRNEQKGKKRDDLHHDKNARRARNNPQNEKKTVYTTRDQEQLRNRHGFTSQEYMMIKETILRESAKQGFLERDHVNKMFKIDRSVLNRIYDFLIEKDEVTESQP